MVGKYFNGVSYQCDCSQDVTPVLKYSRMFTMCVSLINGKYFMAILFLKTPLSDFCSILQLINSQAGTVHAYMAHLCWSGRRVTALDRQVWGRKKNHQSLYPLSQQPPWQLMGSKAEPTPANSSQPKDLSLQTLTICNYSHGKIFAVLLCKQIKYKQNLAKVEVKSS